MWAGAIIATLSMVATIIYCIADKYAEDKVERTIVTGMKYSSTKLIWTGENDFNLKVVKYFDVRFWIICFLCMTYYSGVLPFVAIARYSFEIFSWIHAVTFCMTNTTYHQALRDGTRVPSFWLRWFYHQSLERSLTLLGTDLISVHILLLTAVLMLKVILGSALIIPAHLLLYLPFTHWMPPLIPMIMIGLSFSIVPSTLWPSVPLLTKEGETSTAFGMMVALAIDFLTT